MYKTNFGYITKLIRDDYINYLKKKNINTDMINNPTVMSLDSDPDSKKIYFWQLFSILGKDNILNIVTTFYNYVFEDNEIWFRKVFEESGDIEYHIKGQSYFWFDAMGGGKYYRGGKKLVNLKHSNVSEILNSRGAERWMFHMYRSLKTHSEILSKDSRVIPCILDFLQYFMDEYAVTFDFNFIKIRSSL